MKMVHMYQPDNSSLCGQTCVAMLAGIPLEDSIKVFGSRGRTRTKQVAAALRSMGFECDDKLQRLTANVRATERPNLALIKLQVQQGGRTWGHWAILADGQYYDPSLGIVDSYAWPEIKITAFLPIRRKGDNDVAN